MSSDNSTLCAWVCAGSATGTADIDAVSGATYTSAGYKESLQSALDQAGG